MNLDSVHSDVSDPLSSSSACNAVLNKFKCIYFNARSLRNKLPSLHGLLYSNKYDIICISETWLNSKFTDGLLDPKGQFNIYRCDRLTVNPSGGVCIFTRRNINCTVIFIDQIAFPGVEIIACNFVFNSHVFFTLICCYIPPSASNDLFLSNIKCLSKICNDNTQCIAVGDFNLPKIDWANDFFPGDFKSQTFFSFYSDFGFQQLINEGTRRSNILDLLLTNDPLLISDFAVDAPFINSDHESITWIIIAENVSSDLFSYAPAPVFNWKLSDWDSFSLYLFSIDWVFAFTHCVSSDDFFQVLLDILSHGIDIFVPKSFASNSNIRLVQSKTVRRIMSKRKLLWQRKRDLPSIENQCKYQAITSALVNAINNETMSDELRVIKSGNLGKFYAHVNHRLHHKTGIAPLVNSEGNICVENHDKAEIFSKYFSTIGVIDNGVFPRNTNTVCNDSRCPPSTSYSAGPVASANSTTLSFVYFDSASIYHVISNLKENSAPGPDNLPPLLFKRLVLALLFPLTTLFNIIMQIGSVPQFWKRANVIPIFKKGAASKAANYRPISLTCIICKIFESVIKTSLLGFIYENHLISASQHGFLKGRSTCTNLLETLNDCTEFMSHSKDVLIAYTDFSRAFDCVSVPKLLFKLENMGITGSLLKCIDSLLSDRSQRVKVGSSFSSTRPVMSGVAQGSVLGPILFILFINDLEQYLPSCCPSKFFADDMKSYMPIISEKSLTDFSSMLTSIEKWSSDWQLPLSVDKCNWMIISNRPASHDIKFTLADTNLTRLDETKDLGILFNSRLNFSTHISTIMTNAKQRLYLLRKSFSSCDCDALILAFKTYIIPLVEYCSPVWSPSSVGDILKIESIQRSFTKSLNICSS